MPAKAYFYNFLMTLLLLALLTVAFNRVVDPFWYYRDISIEGINVIKPKFRLYERHVKPAIVQREQPASLIFGSSFAETGFDPLHPALRKPGKSYNFALAGAQWETVACAMWFALGEDQALRRIVLGIHPQSMPETDCQTEIAEMAAPDERAFLFSSDAFAASVNTLLEQRRQKPSHTAEGMYFYTRGMPGTAGRFREFFSRHTPCKLNRAAAALPDVSSAYGKQNKLDLNGLRSLIKAAQERNIELKLVVYPRHALSFEQEYQCGVRQARWDALMQIAGMVENMRADLVTLWDFEGYHEAGTETISDEPGVYWQDPAHFNHEMGNMMLDEMFGIKPPQLGVRLTTTNIRAHEIAESKARASYLDNHPEFLAQLQSQLPGN